MVKFDWKTAVIPLISILMVSLFGGTAIVNLIIAAFYTPHVDLQISVDKYNKHNASFLLLNQGLAPATHLLFTIDNPASISNHSVFSTENYTEDKKYTLQHPDELQFFVPRLIQGSGSLMNVSLSVDPEKNITNGQYKAYTTFDQGSWDKQVSVIQKEKTFSDKITEILNFYGGIYSSSYTSFIIAIGAGLTPLVARYVRRRSLAKKY